MLQRIVKAILVQAALAGPKDEMQGEEQYLVTANQDQIKNDERLSIHFTSRQ